MQISKPLQNILLIFILLLNQGFQKSQAAFDVQSTGLFKDNNICIIMAGSTTSESLNLTSFTVTTESVQSKTSSSGSLCPVPPFFTGGALLTTVNGIKTQADPTVQGFGRGIIISEIAGTDGISSSGDPSGFTSLVTRLGGLASTIFEISLPTGCDVIDDDDDVVGASTDLSTINDFSFPTCSSTTGLTVACNTTSNLLTLATGLESATSTSPAKIRFTISEFNGVADGSMIDSILIKLDSQDVFCPNNTASPLTATIIAKNAINSPTITETIGTANIGTPIQAAKISYAIETATSTKGETSTNETGVTPVLAGTQTTANTIQIEELNNESIPISGQSSPTIINPTVINNAEITSIDLWIIPSALNLFSVAPSESDITFSDNSLIIRSAPYIVMSNADDLNAPVGTLVIPIKQNLSGVNSATVKTIISVKNLKLSGDSTASKDSTISLSFFEPISGAIVNTPGAVSFFTSSTNTVNPQNFSSFAPLSTRAIAQNTIIGGAVNDGTGASQVLNNTDLNALTARDTVLGTPQITNFTKVISSLTPIDKTKISGTSNYIKPNLVLTIMGEPGASIGGAKVKINTIGDDDGKNDSIIVTSKGDGSFNAKLKRVSIELLGSDVGILLNFKQTISGIDGPVINYVATTLSNPAPLCEQLLCGSCDDTCIPTITNVLTFIQSKGGLTDVVSSGGNQLTEVIKAVKKVLGLN